MDTATQSTIRRISKLLALSGSCIFIGLAEGCSGKNHNDWFRFGKEKPVESQQAEQSPDEPVQSSDPNSTTAVLISNPPETQSLPDPIEDDHADPEVDSQPPTAVVQPAQDIHEIIQLYRRLHAEMNLAGRSQVIVELLSDDRERVRLLGFDLASRDLSSGATLSAEVANKAITLLSDPLPSIRSGAARLITRLALPDAMTLLTTALHSEDDQTVAVALLRGIERWPSKDAQEDVLRWYESDGEVRAIAAGAAWSLADLELWDLETHGDTLHSTYRTLDDNQLTNSDMRLIATTGASDDIDRLIRLAGAEDFSNRTLAANALVFTARGVDPLIHLAEETPAFSTAASEAIHRHRLNPNGVRLIASLPWPDEQSRIDSITKICNQLDNDQLAEAVHLIRTDNKIDDNLTIQLLNRLTAGTQSVSTRSAAGVVLLAELELMNQRPDRTLEVISLLPPSGIDPAIAQRATRASAKAHLLLLEFDHAAELDSNPDTWVDTLTVASDQPIRARIAEEIVSRELLLTAEQRELVNKVLNTPAEDTPLETSPDSEPVESAEQP